MATTFDCELMRDFFGTAEMREIFDSRALLQGWLDAEVALAWAETQLGIIPEWAAEAIGDAASASEFDLASLRTSMSASQHPLFPLLQALAAKAGEAGKFVHWGATTQDVMDTGMVLQVRSALQMVERDILEALISIRNLAVRFRDQPMAGRTHGQHAVPITFGLKAAIWGAELARSLDRLRLCHQRVLVGQLSGAAGTSAALGEAGNRVRELFCRRLGLGIPLTPWFSSRDGWAELVGSLSILAGSLEKISLEIVRLQSTEVAEVAEPARVGHVGSSTMPQKRNPFLSETTAALCRLVRGLAPVMTGCMVGAHERDMSTWAVEWLLIPQCMILMSGALAMFKEVISGLAVYPDRMRNNLGMTSGAIVSEAVMMELARSLGRDRAHELMMDATRVSRDKKEDLLAELSGRSEVRAVISPERLAALLEPANYLGDAATTVDEVIGVIAKQAGV